MTTRMAAASSATSDNKGGNEAGDKSTGVNVNPAKKGRSVLFQPYSGYDQPTKDDVQMAMPVAFHRRSQSDTTSVAFPFVCKDVDMRVDVGSIPCENTSPLQLVMDADEFASLTNSSAPVSPYFDLDTFGSVVKGTPKTDCTPERRWPIVEEGGDMEIRHRKQTCKYTSLSTQLSRSAKYSL